jgi:hypothetical protein
MRDGSLMVPTRHVSLLQLKRMTLDGRLQGAIATPVSFVIGLNAPKVGPILFVFVRLAGCQLGISVEADRGCVMLSEVAAIRSDAA